MSKCTELVRARLPEPSGSKVPKYGVSMVSVLGFVIMGTYLLFGYLDP